VLWGTWHPLVVTESLPQKGDRPGQGLVDHCPAFPNLVENLFATDYPGRQIRKKEQQPHHLGLEPAALVISPKLEKVGLNCPIPDPKCP